jgi:glycine oxidase
MTRIDLAVVGGGIIGLSVAREAARRGFAVQLLERDRVGSHASTAAAGILTRRGSSHSDRPGREFYLRSLLEYPEWVAAISRESAQEVPLEEGDDWCLFPHGPAANRFRSLLETESDPSFWSEEEAPPFGSSKTSSELRCFRIRGERWIDPLHLVPALHQAAVRCGAEIEDSCGRVVVSRDGSGWSIRTSRQTLIARTVVVAAGPWSDSVLEPLGWKAATVPVRGQLALVPKLHSLNAMVHLEDMLYAVPRGNWTLVGATMEHGNLEESVTAEGLHALESTLRPLFPNLDISRAGRTWSGIRPRTRDKNPHVGWLEPGLAIASGHFRSGISTAPRTGRLIADLLADKDPMPDASALDPLRSWGWYRD